MSPSKISAITKHVNTPTELKVVTPKKPLKLYTLKSPVSPKVKETKPVTPKPVKKQKTKQTRIKSPEALKKSLQAPVNINTIQKVLTQKEEKEPESEKQTEIVVREDETIDDEDTVLERFSVTVLDDRLQSLIESLRDDSCATKAAYSTLTDLNVQSKTAVDDLLEFKTLLTTCDLFSTFDIDEQNMKKLGAMRTIVQRVLDETNGIKSKMKNLFEEYETALANSLLQEEVNESSIKVN
jgi:hypothetical protein